MNIDKKQFDHSLETFKNVRPSEGAKDRMRSGIFAYARAHNAQSAIRSPYVQATNFSRRSLVAGVAVLFLASGGTALAAQSSLPGDFLYPLKTGITEPLIKLTKITMKAKAQFELELADKRIEELQKLMREHKATETNVQENFVLFREHVREYRTYVGVGNGHSPNDTSGIDMRIAQYQDLVSSALKVPMVYQGGANVQLEMTEPSSDTREGLPGTITSIVQGSSTKVIKENNTPATLRVNTATKTKTSVGEEKINLEHTVNTEDGISLPQNPIPGGVQVPPL